MSRNDRADTPPTTATSPVRHVLPPDDIIDTRDLTATTIDTACATQPAPGGDLLRTTHAADIARYAQVVLGLIEEDEKPGGLLYDVPVQHWQDLHDHVDTNTYTIDAGVPCGADAVAGDTSGYALTAAVEDQVDVLLRRRDRPLSADEADAAGVEPTLRDGSSPRTWASLTPRQRSALHQSHQP